MYLLTVITSATVVDAPKYDADTGNIKEFFSNFGKRKCTNFDDL